MESSAVTLQPPLDGLLVNTGPFVLQEALFKNDLDLIFGDSRLYEYNATIFDHFLLIPLVSCLPLYTQVISMVECMKNHHVYILRQKFSTTKQMTYFLAK